MSIQYPVVVRKAICFVLILSLFFSCAAPMHGRRGENEKGINQTVVQKDRLEVVVTEEEIRKEMQFGVKEKAGSIIMGSMFGFLIGGRIAVGLTGTQADFSTICPAFIGGCIGLPFGAICNYFIVRSLERKNARENIVERKRKGEEKEN
ncbi:MAG TPA: hypothetical protein ENN17_10755 [bacterium]|nr:hypothetical protein [bacterium]